MIDLVSSRRHGRAYETALSLRDTFAVRAVPTDEDLERIVDALDLELVERVLPSGLSEVRSEGLLILGSGLAPDRRRWGIAHGIAHLLGHAGNQIRAARTWTWRQERQADMFAGWFLLAGVVMSARSVFEVAESAGVPLDCAVQWCGWLAS